MQTQFERTLAVSDTLWLGRAIISQFLDWDIAILYSVFDLYWLLLLELNVKAALMGRLNVVVSLVSVLLGGGCLRTPTIAVKM